VVVIIFSHRRNVGKIVFHFSEAQGKWIKCVPGVLFLGNAKQQLRYLDEEGQGCCPMAPLPFGKVLVVMGRSK
jgi:hypothetical protein